MVLTNQSCIEDNLQAIVINNTIIIDKNGTNANLNLYNYLMPFMGILIIIINLVVVISSGMILKTGVEPRPTYMFLGNLALTDLITGIAVTVGKLYPSEKNNQFICAFKLGLIMSSSLSSVYSIGLIGIDRFLYIFYGMQYDTWISPNKARFCIAITWIIGGLIGFLPLMGWNGDTNNGKICWFIFLAPKELIFLTMQIGVLPLLVIIILYTIILHRALNMITKFQNGENKLGTIGISDVEREECNQTKIVSTSHSSKWKAVKIVLFTTGAFLFTWMPYYVACILYVSDCKVNNDSHYCKQLREWIASPLAILSLCNSFLNPIIYGWWHQGFRHFLFKKLNVKNWRINS